MPTICYQPRQFSQSSIEIIDAANEIIAEYQEQGFELTLRQIYYQFVARGKLANKQTEYKRLGSIINDARLAGMIDWDAIEDRTRNLRALSTWAEPAEIVETAKREYREDLWANQDYRPEVWIEKDALVGVIEGVCNELRVPFFACRGYSSQSEQWRASQRLDKYESRGQQPIIFHLGDHDPSGIDMTRDNRDRLSLFVGEHVSVVRLALNMDQVERYRPPPNPAKLTDTRIAGYAKRYGNESWELDALDPAAIAALIRDAVLSIRDEERWAAAERHEAAARESLASVIGALKPGGINGRD